MAVCYALHVAAVAAVILALGNAGIDGERLVEEDSVDLRVEPLVDHNTSLLSGMFIVNSLLLYVVLCFSVSYHCDSKNVKLGVKSHLYPVASSGMCNCYDCICVFHIVLLLGYIIALYMYIVICQLSACTFDTCYIERSIR